MFGLRDDGVSPAVGVVLILALTITLAGVVSMGVLSSAQNFDMKEAKEVGVSVNIFDETGATVADVSIVSGKDLDILKSYEVATDMGRSVVYVYRDAAGTVSNTTVRLASDIFDINTVSYINVVGYFADGVSEVVFTGRVRPGSVVEPVEPALMWTVTFNPNGGSGGAYSKSVAQGASLNLPTIAACGITAPAKTYFGGWKTDGTTYQAGESFTPGKDTTFTAVWKADVTFKANSGTGTMADQVFIRGETKALSANTFTRDGYDFAGWNTSASGTAGYSDNQSISISENTTLYAIWEADTPATYTITYHANNGTTPDVTISDSGLTSPATAKPAKTFVHPSGKTFSKWAVNADGTGASYNAGGAISLSSDMTLYAIWKNGGYYELGSEGYDKPGDFQDSLNEWFNDYYNTGLEPGDDDYKILEITNNKDFRFDHPPDKPIIVSNKPIEISETNLGNLLNPGNMKLEIDDGGMFERAPGYVGALFQLGNASDPNTAQMTLQNDDDADDEPFILRGNMPGVEGDYTASSALLVITSQGTFTIENKANLTALDNNNVNGNGYGGGIYIMSGGKLVVKGDLTLRNNTAKYGGGIYRAGTLSGNKVKNIVYDSNTATVSGDKIYNA